MSADLINLRKARKARDRVAKEKRAGENRAKFGRTKAERTRADAEKEIAFRRFEAHKRGGEGEEPGDGGS